MSFNAKKHFKHMMLISCTALLCGALFLLNGCANNRDLGQASQFQANPFLWRAALEVVSFIPIATTDPIGGVITTAWYASPQRPNERFQLTIYILDRALRADALKVSVFRQTRSGGRGWQSATTRIGFAREIENQILSRARALRLSYETSQ